MAIDFWRGLTEVINNHFLSVICLVQLFSSSQQMVVNSNEKRLGKVKIMSSVHYLPIVSYI